MDALKEQIQECEKLIEDFQALLEKKVEYIRTKIYLLRFQIEELEKGKIHHSDKLLRKIWRRQLDGNKS